MSLRESPPVKSNDVAWHTNISLAGRSTWRIGGPAHWIAQPQTPDALAHLLKEWPDETPRLMLGGGSNILFDDDGFHGIVIDLSRFFARSTLLEEGASTLMDHPATPGQRAEGGSERDQVLRVDAGVNTRTMAHTARRLGLGGAEFLAGIPGTIGGALRMNAGAYGSEMRNIMIQALVMDDCGEAHILTPETLGMDYRTTTLPAGWILLRADFRLHPDDPAAIRSRMQAYNRKRAASQPLRYPSAGSTFKNPPSAPLAWRLIDDAGMRGYRVGDAQVSEKHSNFLINRGAATSDEMRALITRVRKRVAQRCGIELELEVAIFDTDGPRSG
ncbi:MAG: UDP-N-acetylmuramate dehydrogenase [Magnetococcales bacterium]|nr:UDP-N-acetylmuramate dehydrogenase [Magnetococcales bacterium]